MDEWCTHCDDDEAHCEICGEHIKHVKSSLGLWLEEAGEFMRGDEHIIACAQCGITAELELA